MSYFNWMDKSLAVGYNFTLAYGPEESHFMRLNGRDFVYVSTYATGRMDMFCSTLHEVGHMFALRQGKDVDDEALAWKIGLKLNRLLEYPVPEVFLTLKMQQHLDYLEDLASSGSQSLVLSEPEDGFDWDEYYEAKSPYGENSYEDD